jgi:enoyl-CoA hydratase/carnithine racemase
MGEEFLKTVNQLKMNSALKAVVLTGQGRAFSAGGDLKFLLDRSKDSPISNSYELLTS